MRQHGSLGWLVLPALVFFTAFGLIPLVGVLALSFTSWNGIGEIMPIGIDNWVAVLADPGFPHSLGVTFLIMGLSWLVQTPMSILIGTFIAGQQRYRAVLAVLYFVPLLLSSAAIAIAYKALLDPNFGLGAGLGIPLLVQNWLGDPVLAIAMVVFIVSWQYIPFHSLIYQSGVRQIPASLYEAARIDGAGRVRQFFSITLPQLKYTIITSSTLIVAGSMVFFDLIFVLTLGRPERRHPGAGARHVPARLPRHPDGACQRDRGGDRHRGGAAWRWGCSASAAGTASASQLEGA